MVSATLLLPLLLNLHNIKIDYGDCGSVYEIKDVNLQGCSMIPCNLKIGNTYEISMILRTTTSSNSLAQSMYLNLNEHEVIIPTDVIPRDQCSNVGCPVTISNNLKFQTKFIVSNEAVPGRAELVWIILSDRQEQMVCMKTAVNLIY